MLYASVVAIKQDDLKRLIAYSSIAHIGLMCLALFASNKSGMQGAVLQMFVHGINIIGLWIVANTIEQNYGTRKISELGGLAQQAPTLTIMLVVIALANIALPLTNAFVGEFMMFNGMLSSKITRYNELDTVLAGLCIILAAVYTLNMIKQVFYGAVKREPVGNTAFTMPVKLALTVIIVLILVMGVYPKPFLDLTNEAVDAVLNRMITVK
jgi:NADH-quinone oxidoreductase subunit M